MGAITDTFTGYLGMDAITIIDNFHYTFIQDVAAYGTAGSNTLVVADGTLFGNFASGKIWSLLTWANEVAEVMSVDGNTLHLKRALSLDTIKARYLYVSYLRPVKMVRIHSAKISESFNTNIKSDTEKVEPDILTNEEIPTAFFDSDISVERTLTITGFITTDRRRTTRLYREALWNLSRLGKKVLPEDYDKVDIIAEFDSTLTYEENKGILRDKLKILIKDIKEQAMESKSAQEQLDREKLDSAEKEAEEYNTGLTYDDNKSIETHYAPVINGIKKISQGYSNLLFIKGRGGIGKSYQIRKALVESKADFVEVCGEVTEAYLYRLIFENNGKILWFKDVVKLLQNVGSLNLLKSATETEEKRILTKSNYSKQQDDLPNKFVCKCKFVFDYNNLFGISLKEDFEALATRGDYKEIPFSNSDVRNILNLIAKDDWQKEVTKHVVECFEKNGSIKLNLRTQWKAFKTYEFCKANELDWKEQLTAELNNISKTRAMLYTLIGEKTIKTKDLKVLLLKNDLISSLRTADNKINEWLYIEELYKWSEADRNFIVCINPKQ